MDKPVPRNTEVLLERCESGRIGLTANPRHAVHPPQHRRSSPSPPAASSAACAAMVGISAEFMDRIMDRAEWGKRDGRLPQGTRTGIHREFFESPRTEAAGSGCHLTARVGTHREVFRRLRPSGAAWYPVGGDEPGLSAYRVGI